jgi:3-oxoacyl-[acyl-carrier-protein] synthase-3
MTGRAGLVAVASYLPQGHMEAGEIAAATGLPERVVREKLGIVRKVLPGPDDGPHGMAVRAAERLIEEQRLDPMEIDVVISITEEYKEYPVWTTGIALQDEIGARRAWAFDLAQRCGTGVLALKLAQSLIISDPGVNTVLIAGGYRNIDLIDYQNPRVRFMYNLAAGGGAALVRRGGQNPLLGVAIRTDGSFSRDVIAPRGGTAAPLGDWSRPFLDVPDPDGMKQRLEERSMSNFLAVVDEALERSRLTRADIGYLAILHMKRSAHLGVLRELGLREEQSVYLEEYGHIGQIDQIISTELALRSGRLQDGKALVWVSAGIGYAWDAAVIGWGRA